MKKHRSSSSPNPALSFYAGKSILITGGTGFLGKVIVEKLLRCIGDQLGTVFLLIRPKVDVKKRRTPGTHVLVEEGLRGAHERLRSDVFDSRVFDRCRDEVPNFENLFFRKVVAISGDLEAVPPAPIVSHPAELARLRNEVNVVIHVAATVAFDEPIRTAFRQNIAAAVAMFEEARAFLNLCSYVHVSTAYVTCDRPDGFVEDSLAPLPHLLGDDAKIGDILSHEWHSSGLKRSSSSESDDDDGDNDKRAAVPSAAGRGVAGGADIQLSDDRASSPASMTDPSSDVFEETAATPAPGASESSEGTPLAYSPVPLRPLSSCLPMQIVESVLSMDEDTANSYHSRLMGGYPNTYCLSKAICERVLTERRGTMPLCIVRPSIIGGAWREPVPGWTDSPNAIGAVYLFGGLGILRHMPAHTWLSPNVVPVDVAASHCLIAAASNANQDRAVIAHSGVYSRKLTWAHCEAWSNEYFQHNRPRRAISFPAIQLQPSEFMFRCLYFFTYQLPIWGFSSFCRLWPSESRTKLLRKLQKMSVGVERISNAFTHFVTHDWVFDTTSMKRLEAALNPADYALFRMDTSKIDFHAYMLYFSYGLHKYLLGEDDLAREPVALVHSHKTAEFIDQALQWDSRQRELFDVLDSVLLVIPALPFLVAQPRDSRLRLWAAGGLALLWFKRRWQLAKQLRHRGDLRARHVYVREALPLGFLFSPTFLACVELVRRFRGRRGSRLGSTNLPGHLVSWRSAWLAFTLLHSSLFAWRRRGAIRRWL